MRPTHTAREATSGNNAPETKPFPVEPERASRKRHNAARKRPHRPLTARAARPAMAQGEGDNASGTMQAGHRPLMSPPPWPLPAILSRGKIAGDLASVPGVGRSPCHQCHFRSSGMSPAHPHIRPITPFLVPGGMDIRGEARSATTGDLWRWVFSRPGREAGSGTTTRRVWRQCTGNRIFQPRRGRRKGPHNRGSSQRQIRQIGTFETEQAGAFVTAPGASKTQRH